MQIIASASQPSGKERTHDLLSRFKQHPLVEVLGVLIVAVAAKSGYGLWAAGGILTLFPIYFGAVTFRATRPLAAFMNPSHSFMQIRHLIANGHGALSSRSAASETVQRIQAAI